ncbi:hypothetical protein SAY86_013990 [Trapa natans]|uniref:Formin-like protein n=1 Tax=Trapa natans TaxID=22666 RepID=A0AAN7KSH6_TRANT|nr:hypothetical protein SAY86_013990 [Trapa natans]
MAKATVFSLLFLLVPLLSKVTASSNPVGDRLRQRRLLHQPLFPVKPNQPSLAPALPPLPPQRHPKLPFSTTPSTTKTPNSFFPTAVPSPPPPTMTPLAPPRYLPTFPANISSLLLTHAPSTSPPLRRRIAAIAFSVSVLSVALIATFAIFAHFYLCHDRHSVDYDPTDKAARIDIVRFFPPDATSSSDSTVLKPHSSSNTSTEFLYLGTLPNPPGISGEIGEEEDDDVFFSPKGSCSMSDESNSPSPPLMASPISLKSCSPEVMILRFPAPSQPPLPPPPPPYINDAPDGSNAFSRWPSSSACISDVLMGKLESSVVNEDASIGKRFVPKKLPPAPPPMPPPRFWERPQGLRVRAESFRPVVFNSLDRNEGTPRPRLKPLRWDKVQASSNRVMVWDQIKPSNFQLNEEMIERLFVLNGSNLSIVKENAHHPPAPLLNQETRVLDQKKSQNVSILLRALNVTVEEVCESLLEGNADSLGSELLESLLKMAPTKEEEGKLRDLKDDLPFKLGPAEKFLKALLDIPFAFKRVDVMLYVVNFETESDYLKRCFETLESASKELRSSKLFMKLLEAVLKTGNRMNVGTNRGDAHAFKLDALLKLVDVKGTDGKTTLLHFVVQEILRSQGSKLHGGGGGGDAKDHLAIQNEVEFKKLGLQIVSGLSGELASVKKAATMDSAVLSNVVLKLAIGIGRVKDILKLNGDEMNGRFLDSMNGFLAKADDEIKRIQEQERVTLEMLKETTEYFHGDSAMEEAHHHPLGIFMVVRDFLSTLDRVYREVGKVK